METSFDINWWHTWDKIIKLTSYCPQYGYTYCLTAHYIQLYACTYMKYYVDNLKYFILWLKNKNARFFSHQFDWNIIDSGLYSSKSIFRPVNAVISIKQYIEHAHILIDVWVELSFSGVEGGGCKYKIIYILVESYCVQTECDFR